MKSCNSLRDSDPLPVRVQRPVISLQPLKHDRCSGLKARSVPVTRGSDNLNGGSRITVLGHWQTPTASEFESRFEHSVASVRSLRLGCFGA